MKNRRWFFALSVLLLAALLCMLGPAALAEGPDSETAFRADLARLGAHTDEIGLMREEALVSYLNCLFDAEETDDPIEQERLLDKAELSWTLYTDLLSVQGKAEYAAMTQPEDPFFADAKPDPFCALQEPTPETGEEFRLDDCFPPEADFLPGEGCVPYDGYDWGFAPCPFSGAHGPRHHDWVPGWAYWDDGFDVYGDPWDYFFAYSVAVPDEEAALTEEEIAQAEQPVEIPAYEETEPAGSIELIEPDAAALPVEIADETDEYADWAEFEELFMQALFEALFGDDAQNMLPMANPWIDAADPDEAAAVSGLRLDVPEALPKGMELQSYRAMEDLVEADYSDGYDELTLRASLNQKGLPLTGDYNDYSTKWQEKVGDLVIDCLGDGEKINAAAWTVDGVNYSLDMAPGKEAMGLSYDEVSAITAAVSAIPVWTEVKEEPSAEPAVPSDEALEMPFELTEAENLSSEAIEVPAETQPTVGRQTRLIVGGGETYVYYD